MFICKYCHQPMPSLQSLGGHTKFCSLNPRREQPFKGVTPELRKQINFKLNTDCELIAKRRASNQVYLKTRFDPSKIKRDPVKELLRREKLSGIAKKRGLGGLTARSGRGIKGWYKGYFCDSTWELAWVIYHLDFDIAFERNKEAFFYEFGGKRRKYYPDFRIGDVFHEIKGYNSPQFESKRQQFPYQLVVWDKLAMQPIFTYCFEKYGRNLESLYDQSENEH